ncbi:hypothetical protein [Klebsiella pneumoniae]|uniref:hypothetical protein n=1 Tax=Klebsiella pneumoniae TaxID=573 RepID=UPI00050CED3B|nr:hypothetical protein [Klebsiella pneumoniae]KAB7976429.1 hypothetical protein GCK90_23690 [Klebsiella pneumoniae]KAB7977699.1 hypothetical protein GCK80_21255 [Klebsiella pneumoniae]KAB7992413.1 hypothetical protein GCK94_02235 [Klebsiella pneumoniae]KAB8003535.1 hypothetical protein GCK96_01595 [Klebsiella pneumoniae]MBG3862348.1 hypothetical protein [Klebsiella pneumoniae]
MTITLQAVNELIASLESAGELSIREQKFLKLAKAYQQLAAENVGLRKLIAENWNMRDLLRQLMAGRPGGVYFNKWEKLIVGVLNETPATDRIMAGIKADGVEEFAAYQRAITEEWACKEGHSSLLKVAESAELFAKQLREGADK